MHETVIIIAKYGIALPIVSYLVLAVYERRRAKELLLFTFISAILTLLLVKLATTVHTDPRPFVRDGVQPYFSSSTDNGFPSDHTALSAVIACIVFKYNKLAGLLLIAAALVIGGARVISGVHHGQDVIGAILIAGVSVYLAALVVKRLNRRNQSEE